MYRILIVDDILENRKLLASIITDNTDYEVMTAKSGNDIVGSFENIEKDPPDLILLDILMPKINGFHVARILRNNRKTRDIPIIFITALTDQENKTKAFEAGGVDYISKPFQKEELLARIDAHLRMKELHDELKLKQRVLRSQETQLRELLSEKESRIEHLRRQAESGVPIVHPVPVDPVSFRVNAFCEDAEEMAGLLGQSRDFIRSFVQFAPFHDAGEALLPAGLLAKPGRFTELERRLMSYHVVLGGQILDMKEMDVMARNIALYHHERWDGKGYLSGLKGENIPLEARIVSVLDAYHSLKSHRPHRSAFGEQEAIAVIEGECGKAFDPAVVKEFLVLKRALKE